jgi:hypothetical protein
MALQYNIYIVLYVLLRLVTLYLHTEQSGLRFVLLCYFDIKSPMWLLSYSEADVITQCH